MPNPIEKNMFQINRASQLGQRALDLIRDRTRASNRHEQFTLPKPDEQTQRDVSATFSDTEYHQQITTNWRRLQQERLTADNQLYEIRMQRPIDSNSDANNDLKQYTKLSNQIVNANRFEASARETSFKSARSEVKRLQQENAHLEQKTKEIEAYHESLLEQKKDPHNHSNSITYPLADQLMLLDTALTSLQETKQDERKEILGQSATSTDSHDKDNHDKQDGLTQNTARQKKYGELLTQKHLLESTKRSQNSGDKYVPDMRKDLVAEQTALDTYQQDLQTINKQLAETERFRARLQKKDVPPSEVAQQFAEHITMVKANVRYLELELAQKQKSRQELPKRATDLKVNEKYNLEIEKLDKEIMSLENKLTTEKAYASSLDAQRDARAQENISVRIPAKVILQMLDYEIAVTKVYIESAQRRYDRTDTKDKDGRQNLQLDLEDYQADLQFFTNKRSVVIEQAKSQMATYISHYTQRHGLTSAQLPEELPDNLTLAMPAETRKNELNAHRRFIEEELKSAEDDLEAEKTEVAEAAAKQDLQKRDSTDAGSEIARLEGFVTQAQQQLQICEKQQENLEKFRATYATNIHVSRPLDEQITMVQNLQRLQPDIDRLDTLVDYHEKLVAMRQRTDAQHPLRKPVLPLEKQIALVKEHVAILQTDDDAKKIEFDNRVTHLVKRAYDLTHTKNTLSEADFKSQMEDLVKQSNAMINAREKSKSPLTAEKRYLQELEEKTVSPYVNMQTMVSRNTQQQLMMLDALITYKQTQRDMVKEQLKASQLRKIKIQEKIKKTSSDYIPAHLDLDQQLELVSLNLQYLRTKSKQSATNLHAQEAERDTQRTRIRNLNFCNNSLINHELSHAFGQSDKWQFEIWTTHMQYLRDEAKTLEHDMSNTGRSNFNRSEERLSAMEDLEKIILSIKKHDQEALTTLQTQEFLYVGELDRHRDKVRVIHQEVMATLNIQGTRHDTHHEKLQALQDNPATSHLEESDDPEKSAQRKILNDKISKQYAKLEAARELLYELEREKEDLDYVLREVTREITSHHELLKETARKKNESIHPFFLNEHIIDIDLLRNYNFATPLDTKVFCTNDDAACVPTALRMIGHDMNCSFAENAKVTADALNTNGRGGALIADVPAALKKLGHPIPYEITALKSIGEMIERTVLDKYGKPLPFIIGIKRPDNPSLVGHVIVCNGIIDMNEHQYAIIRDSLLPKAFAIRLDHIDEVLKRPSVTNSVSGQWVAPSINVAYPVPNKISTPPVN